MAMQKLFMTVLLSVSIASFAAPAPQSTNDIEVACRTKAKEIAAQVYRTCVDEQKSSQLEKIKKEYEAQLQALKSDYEAKLKKLKSQPAKASPEDFAPSATAKPKKQKSRVVAKMKRAAPKKGPVTEMTVELAPDPVTPTGDESMMDLPEPIPIEVESESAAY